MRVFNSHDLFHDLLNPLSTDSGFSRALLRLQPLPGNFQITEEKLQEIENRCAQKEKRFLENWHLLVADALLLTKMHELPIDQKLEERFKEIVPFPEETDAAPLSFYLGKKGAMAVFPLSSNQEQPYIGHLWVFEDEEKPHFFVPRQKFGGDSYNLALALAKKALTGSVENRKELAHQWIVTGNVEKQAVRFVTLGNKLQLDASHGKKWLIPLDNVKNVSPEEGRRLIIRSADSIETAWNHICRQGIRQVGRESWPSDVSEIHTLVGGSVKPLLFPILIMLEMVRSQKLKIVLWHSSADSSLRSRVKIEKILARLYKDKENTYELDAKEISSKDMAEAEKTLLDYFEKRSPSVKERLIFNVTSGNRLMSYAVQSLARLYPNIDLIYRDIDEKNLAFSILNYREFPPYLGIIEGTLSPHYNKDFLCSSEKDIDPDEFVKNLLSQEK